MVPAGKRRLSDLEGNAFYRMKPRFKIVWNWEVALFRISIFERHSEAYVEISYFSFFSFWTAFPKFPGPLLINHAEIQTATHQLLIQPEQSQHNYGFWMLFSVQFEIPNAHECNIAESQFHPKLVSLSQAHKHIELVSIRLIREIPQQSLGAIPTTQLGCLVVWDDFFSSCGLAGNCPCLMESSQCLALGILI